MSPFLLAVVVGLLCYALFRLAEHYQSHRELMKIEGEPHHFLWGHFRFGQLGTDFGESYFSFLKKCCTAFEMRPFRLMYGPIRHAVVVSHPDDVHLILKPSTEPHAEVVFRLLRPWMGTGLSVVNGEKWGRNRRLLNPAFHASVLKTYLAVFESCIDTAMVSTSLASQTLPWHVSEGAGPPDQGERDWKLPCHVTN
eukprot:m.108996 g.108996  ORF g.108996 m.108996 type:complete len:196 (+) comp37332_c0_seq10:153-740(+)